MKQQVNKAEWHEYKKVCRNCAFWQADGPDTATGICSITDNETDEGREACSDLRFSVYDTEQR